jgi:hypothetical protein
MPKANIDCSARDLTGRKRAKAESYGIACTVGIGYATWLVLKTVPSTKVEEK